jgi:hypothetical protein
MLHLVLDFPPYSRTRWMSLLVRVAAVIFDAAHSTASQPFCRGVLLRLIQPERRKYPNSAHHPTTKSKFSEQERKDPEG